MKKVNKIYCVMTKKGEIIGRFIDKTRALNYMIDYYFDGYDEVIIKIMTVEEYIKYTKKLIDKCK